MKTILTALAIYSIASIHAEPLKDFTSLKDANADQKSIITDKENGVFSLEGTHKAQSVKIKATDSAKVNFSYTVDFIAPKDPQNWSSLTLLLFGENEGQKCMPMFLFEHGGYNLGFYPNSMAKSPISIEPGKAYSMKVEAIDKELTLRLWEKGSAEPVEPQCTTSIPFNKINEVGLRAFAMPFDVTSTDFVEGNVKPIPSISLKGKNSSAEINPYSGQIKSLTLKDKKIDFFRGALGGPSLSYETATEPNAVVAQKSMGGSVSGLRSAGQEVALPLKSKGNGDKAIFETSDQGIDYTMTYALENDSLVVKVTAKNTTDKEFAPNSLFFNLGIDTYMATYPEWNEKHFPTFLRSEKTHFWGYAMAPNGSIIAFNSPDPIPSWKLRYNHGGHRINGMQLELLTTGIVPKRSSQTQISLKPGEERTWTVCLDTVEDLASVPKVAAEKTGSTLMSADRYTAEPGETVTISLHGKTPKKLTHITTDQFETPLEVNNGQATVTLPADFGLSKVIAETEDGKISEIMLTTRRPWSWYMEQARRWTAYAKQTAGSHVEQWYGFYPSFIIREHSQNAALDKQIDADFDEIMPLMYEYDKNMKPTAPAYPGRIQNHAGGASVFAHKYRVSKDIKDLERASQLVDYIMTFQSEDGAYRSGHGTHYTSVIYVAKFLMEVMLEEAKLAEKDPVWKERYDKHYKSVERSMEELVRNLDNIETEGEMTFEDGMISCSYTQLAAWARLFAKPEDKQKYIAAAEKLVEKHRCLSQIVQPDSRMNNASLRFWESQYDVLYCPNFMNSPHGWSAWRLYGLFDLYRLTGKTTYLNQALNGMGSCANLMNPVTGDLNWAFITDPKITTDVFEEDPNNPSKGKRTLQTIGEDYRPMISHWWRAPYGKAVFGYGPDGGCCDSDVHEIFKCLGEHALLTTWLIIDEKGNPEVWNGKVERKGDTYTVTPSEGYVKEVHVNTAKPVTIKTTLDKKEINQKVDKGLISIQ